MAASRFYANLLWKQSARKPSQALNKAQILVCSSGNCLWLRADLQNRLDSKENDNIFQVFLKFTISFQTFIKRLLMVIGADTRCINRNKLTLFVINHKPNIYGFLWSRLLLLSWCLKESFLFSRKPLISFIHGKMLKPRSKFVPISDIRGKKNASGKTIKRSSVEWIQCRLRNRLRGLESSKAKHSKPFLCHHLFLEALA